ncbi:acyl-protein synthetase LuxE [Ulvibacter sp. MAR_2010_11]|uniref:LuxE/PaaK family acyltransferase n=1 Tax=Ulvibacter sp. MAR_2010_11 TaxID=1250229 RepID=UPI000C2CAF01|nr:acyl transferase [Ulvibacter sp. MAR_2010_11]PKA82659.1 acyl-protein synthetase LuxE [Ulvibacter sp. MAR_2010_11]
MLEKDIFTISSSEAFETTALEVFRFQYRNVPVYREFCDYLSVSEASVQQVSEIPFLPIQFFKSHTVLAENTSVAKKFTSSGTTGSIPSTHHVANLNLYEKSFTEAFTQAYGKPSEYTILALLPSYLERGGSSLVYMVDFLIKASGNSNSGFYLDNTSALIEKIRFLEASKQKTILIGVSYALLDLLERQKFQLQHTIIMETGGMKGKRKEMIKDELHSVLKEGFGVNEIHSEYGMTELLSQAYSKGNNIFTCPPWMKITTRDPEDALTQLIDKTGGINVIDLANLYSCAFIATQDLGKIYKDGSFEILGRFDTSDIRGCNLMVL